MKRRKFIRILPIFSIGILLICIFFLYTYSSQITQLLGFRIYTVLSNSMEPTIPTYSLVFTHISPNHLNIKENTIITFHANRLGENILLTHYFRKIQVKNGIEYFRTQPEGKDINDESTYDNYETVRDDILGTYMFHIPYLGKIFLFLKSPFGFIMYAELFVVFLINQFVKAKWKEKDKKAVAEAGVELAKGDFEEGYVEGDIEVLIDINDFNNSDKALLEMEEFNKKQISEWH